MNLQERRLEFLNDTVNYYSEDVTRRAVDCYEICVYFDETTKNKCAIGRFIDENILKSKIQLFGSVARNEIFELLPKNIQELEKRFLMEMQFLHDNSDNWNENGLSEQGKHQVEVIKKVHCS